ncbi:MAG: hypothetical protein SAK29_24890 [Scytonema sp. PMC 1069.18]|nr:hypothetical protein [Scytonema sp. PMC 1069.18]MEC4880636.1 hypothetical protein [Scytonema sp. PMC 1070.18]
MLYCHDEKAGFEKFFQLLSEFKQRDRSLDGDDFEQMARQESQKENVETMTYS